MSAEAQLKMLEDRAQAVHALLQYAPRAFVLELTGTPKAGKSTTASVLSHFFKRNDFRVHVLQERASFCPIPSKGHLFFNTWTASTMLAELLENVDTDTDIIVKDRGLFDSLIWFQLQRRAGEITSQELRRIAEFLLLPRWRSLVNLVVVMRVPPAEAIKREHAPLISLRGGSIMNKKMLSAYNKALDDTRREYGHLFRNVEVIETTGSDPRATNMELAGRVLDELRRFLNPRVMAVPRALVERLTRDGPSCFLTDRVNSAVEQLEKNRVFIHRDEAEQRSDLVQLVSCAVLTYGSKVFLFHRREQDPKYSLYGKATIWRGSHVRRGKAGESLKRRLNAAIVERITEDLYLNRRLASNLIGYTWDTTHPRSKKHLGLISTVSIENADVAEALHEREFRKGRGYGMTGEFWPPRRLLRSADEVNLEPWSTMTLEHLARRRASS